MKSTKGDPSLTKDHYQTLGLEYSAGTDDIRIAFRTLAATCHPDRNPGMKAREQFLEIRAAYEALIDPASRTVYLDSLRHAVQEVRREEARRFREGEADILVATDAIAMGLNLPAHTVVLGESQKFDGQSMGPVPLPLLRQIAGRAGRYGHHDSGIAAGMDGIAHSLVQRALSGTDDRNADHPLYLSPPRPWIEAVHAAVPDITTCDLLLAWKQTLSQSPVFTAPRLAESLEKAQLIDSHPELLAASPDERLRWVSAPVSLQDGQVATYRAFLLATMHPEQTPQVPQAHTGMRADEQESAYKLLSLYCWFHFRYPEVFREIGQAMTGRRGCVDRIIQQIRKGLRRYCRECGTVLPKHHSYAICDKCHHQRFSDPDAYYGGRDSRW